MNATQILSGNPKYTHFAVGFVRTALLGQLGFQLQRAYRWEDVTTQTPVADTVKEAMGEEFTKPTKLDTSEIIEGMAAAFVLCHRWAKTTNPANGRRNEGILRFITTPENHVLSGIDYDLKRDSDRIKGEAAKVALSGRTVDLSKALDAVKENITKKANANSERAMKEFVAYLHTSRKVDDFELIDTAMEAFANTGRNLTEEIKRSVNARTSGLHVNASIERQS